MRRSFILTVLILAAALGCTGAGLAALLKHEPSFYSQGCSSPDAADPDLCARVVTRFGDLKNDIRSKPDWGATFTATELNAFFRETLDRKAGGLSGLLPDGLNDPRVSIEGDRLRLAGRYGTGLWSTVLSVELRAWLVKGEMNTVALELVGMWAGALPLGTQSVLDAISETARDSNVVVTWFRRDGHPVGILRFYADQVRPTTQIRTFKIEGDSLTVAGRALHEMGGTPVVGLPEPE